MHICGTRGRWVKQHQHQSWPCPKFCLAADLALYCSWHLSISHAVHSHMYGVRTGQLPDVRQHAFRISRPVLLWRVQPGSQERRSGHEQLWGLWKLLQGQLGVIWLNVTQCSITTSKCHCRVPFSCDIPAEIRSWVDSTLRVASQRSHRFAQGQTRQREDE